MGGKYRVKRFTPIPERFEAYWTPEPNTGCWLWTGTVNARGYGTFPVRQSKSVLAHRQSYEVHIGQIPSGLCVCHRCDTPSCVNPSHLFLGTNADNVADKVRKGRQSRGEDVSARQRGDKHWTRRRPYPHTGESVHNARLSRDGVIAIRNAYAAGDVTQRALAARYGVTQTAIHGVVTMRTWRDV
jgi:hypothetical protein